MDSAEVGEGRDKKAEMGRQGSQESKPEPGKTPALCLGSTLGGGARDGAGRGQ